MPIENHAEQRIPTMARHVERARLAEELGFAALWLRDVPFDVPSFGDAGHLFDPFVYLGLLAARTERIALGVASVVLPLRHPAHVAKAAASVDVLSGGRLILGVASGDRPEEYPAMGADFEERGARFRESFNYIRRMADDYPAFERAPGSLDGHLDMLPKPTAARMPLLVTGSSLQDPDWIAEHGDGWMTYPRDPASQAHIIADFRARPHGADKPVMQPLYVDLDENRDAQPRPMHLGFHLGARHLSAHLAALEAAGVNHIALNLRFYRAAIESTLNRLADEVLPDFS